MRIKAIHEYQRSPTLAIEKCWMDMQLLEKRLARASALWDHRILIPRIHIAWNCFSSESLGCDGHRHLVREPARMINRG
jgi:hypothetical protein